VIKDPFGFLVGMNQGSSHRRLLLTAIEWGIAGNSFEFFDRHSVLELGMGPGSTQYLSRLCRSHNIDLQSLDDNSRWALEVLAVCKPNPNHWCEAFNPKATSWHSEIDAILKMRPPLIAFVDLSPAEARGPVIDQLHWSNVPIIIAHDTEGSGYMMDGPLSRFRYRIDDPNTGAVTTAVSDIIDVSKWELPPIPLPV